MKAQAFWVRQDKFSGKGGWLDALGEVKLEQCFRVRLGEVVDSGSSSAYADSWLCDDRPKLWADMGPRFYVVGRLLKDWNKPRYLYGANSDAARDWNGPAMMRIMSILYSSRGPECPKSRGPRGDGGWGWEADKWPGHDPMWWTGCDGRNDVKLTYLGSRVEVRYQSGRKQVSRRRTYTTLEVYTLRPGKPGAASSGVVVIQQKEQRE